MFGRQLGEVSKCGRGLVCARAAHAHTHRGTIMVGEVGAIAPRSSVLRTSSRSSHQGIGYSYESIITGNQADAHSPAR